MLQALLLASILFTAPDAPDPRDVVEAAGEYRRAHGAEILQEFSVLPATPNVASDEHDIRRNAEQLAEAFRRRGVAISVHERAGAVPIANHDDNQHGPDENLRVGNLWYGIDLMALILTLDKTADTGLTSP